MTTIDEIADSIYRISTPVQIPGGGFSFNQYLVVDDEPLLFHTGPRRLFPATVEAIGRVMDPPGLRYVGVSHCEADECGALNEFLDVASSAVAVGSRVAAMTSLDDMFSRPARALADGEELALGKHTLRWFDTPHLPHGWECGYMFDSTTGTLFCGDLFTQPGDDTPPLTEGDILGPSEALRAHLDYFSYGKDATRLLDHLAAARPTTLACMHGSAWRGDGAKLLRELGAALFQQA
ncbi:MAG TPA: MBL fold metallo-hydrolase [Chloroflexota bacterium]|nr:MBL fold metallo-hydrolase [Chloroflexota bacterium]